MKTHKLVKPRRCRNKSCGGGFIPTRPLQVVCGPICAIAVANLKRLKEQKSYGKEERLKIRARKLELKPLQYWLRQAQKAVNDYVRRRDLKAGHGCITCGTFDAEEWHAGHWISVGASSSLRFDLANIHLQCRQCNYFGAGKAQEYEARLPARIGQLEVERLKFAPRDYKWSRDECQGITKKYKKLAKEI